MSDLTPEIEERARQLADAIRSRRGEVTAGAPGRSSRAREIDGARINGMVIALACVLGRPGDMQLAEQFIDDAPAWRALL